MGAQRDLGKDFRRDVIDEIEEVVTPWLDLLAQKRALQKRIDVAEQAVLQRMRAKRRKVYEGSDGTVVHLELSAKLRAKVPKQPKDDEDEEEDEKPRKGKVN